MNKQLKNQLKTAFAPPPPQHKTTFIANLNFPKASRLSFILSQAGYISKLFWCISALVAVAMFALIQLYNNNPFIIGLLSACLPFLTLLGITELQRSTTYGMTELEGCCKHSFAQITLIRLTIIGITHTVMLITLCLFCIDKIGFTPIRTVLYMVTPFLLCTCLSLAVILYLRTRETLYICGCITGAVAIATTISGSMADIYADQFTVIWAVVAVVLLVLIALGVRKFIKHTEDLQWNLPLTA